MVATLLTPLSLPFHASTLQYVNNVILDAPLVVTDQLLDFFQVGGNVCPLASLYSC